MGNFSYIPPYVSKGQLAAEGTDNKLIPAKLKAASALAFLEASNYSMAAKTFLQVPFELGSAFNEIITVNDIAVYAGICGLATFSRAELRDKIINNSEFKQFLELEPHIRELIFSFYNSKYSALFNLLENWRVCSL